MGPQLNFWNNLILVTQPRIQNEAETLTKDLQVRELGTKAFQELFIVWDCLDIIWWIDICCENLRSRMRNSNMIEQP